jgi:tetratricopeptide (TPR) repeat protein
MNAYRALRRAGRHSEADRLALDAVVGPLTRAGFYRTLLAEWMPDICGSEDPQTRGEALGQTGKLLHHVGDYETALSYLKRSLAIREEIGDKSGEGVTLNNIAGIYHARGDYETALSYLKRSLAIREEIGDRAGLCATLFNMGHIHAQADQVQEALGAWVAVYAMARQMNLAQALEALAKLAPRLGMPEGLEGWEALAKRLPRENERNPPSPTRSAN